MTTYSLPKEKLPDFLNALSEYEIWAPVNKDTSTLFEVIEDCNNVSLDLQNQPVISKKAVFPQTELLFSYDMKGGGLPSLIFRTPKIPSFLVYAPVMQGVLPCLTLSLKETFRTPIISPAGVRPCLQALPAHSPFSTAFALQ